MRRQLEIPKTLFHITKQENVKSILELGLIPHKSKGACHSDEIGDAQRYGVYLTSDPKAVIDIDCDFTGVKGLVLIKVDVAELEIIPDTAYDGLEEYFTAEDIQEGLFDQFSYIHKGEIKPDRIKGIIENLEEV